MGIVGDSKNKHQQGRTGRVQGADANRPPMQPFNPSSAQPGPCQRPAARAIASDALVRRVQRQMANSSMDSASEARWITQAKAGDGQAFAQLIGLHFPRVYSLLFRMIGNHEDAEDLAQDCFIKAQRALGHYRQEAQFSTWLFRIAVHLSRDHFRKKQGLPVSLELSHEATLPSKALGPAAEVRSREFQVALRRAMDGLSHKRRVALVLRTQEGMEYERIAQVLECNEQTARVHVMKARKQLRGWLAVWKETGDQA